MALVGLNNRFLRVNQAFTAFIGYSEQELLALTFPAISHPEDLAADRAGLQALLDGTAPSFQMEKRYRHQQGHTVWGLLSVSLVRDRKGDPLHFIRQIKDVTARKQIEAERDALLESEQRKSEQLAAAIREAHHRIKNNLQAVTDLLSLELDAAERAGGSESLRDSIERIQAISLVHDLLSRDTDMELVDIQQLAERLVPTVLRASSRSSTAVDLNLSIPSRLLSSKKATALALVLNELISNAAKHALPGRPAGTLRVELEDQDECLLLVVQDDGPGLPDGFDLDQHSNVGLQVARTLVEGSLRGRLSLRSQNGLRAEVSFVPQEEESHQ
jgi:PAS domain S-box-containing protein